jgi:hypothetical protein
LNFSSVPSLAPSSSLMPTLTPVIPLSDTPLGSQTSAHLHRVSSRESLSVSACDQLQHSIPAQVSVVAAHDPSLPVDELPRYLASGTPLDEGSNAAVIAWWRVSTFTFALLFLFADIA